MDVLKLTTAGSVDDGKSTLIGRLLYDSNSISKDQVEAIQRVSDKKGNDYLDLSLLTDGLTAEREQGITIDVSYKYFSSDKRRFIIADCPGHVEYTRNMITGTSDSDLIIILIDARNGIIEQTKRHFYIASMMEINEVVVCINKMDLVDYKEETFNNIQADFLKMAERINGNDEKQNISFIPICALKGENIVKESDKFNWYNGPTVFNFLENVNLNKRIENKFRFPVQYVIRPHSDTITDYRGFAGRVMSGNISVGDEITVLPSLKKSKVRQIDVFDQKQQALSYKEYGTILLEDEIDLSRGDLMVKSGEEPKLSKEINATICWVNETPFQNKKYIIKYGTMQTYCKISSINQKLEIHELQFEQGDGTIELNDICNITIKTAVPMPLDRYDEIKYNGCFILVDEQTNMTIASGIIE
ncbi:MAG: GTP-binding protein [Flavobacteriales bacterium]|jgi:sulfate adenylyltransferase subunit 1|nr:GTP-binding protein [Flavobacteriales bacterium]